MGRFDLAGCHIILLFHSLHIQLQRQVDM
jgi:hypothetical protein